MSKWFFILLTVGSAAALAAAVMFRPAPATMVFGVVDSGKYFERQPDVKILTKIEKAGRRVRNISGDPAASFVSDTEIMNSEWETARRGMIESDNLLVSYWAGKTFSDLRKDYALIFSDRDAAGRTDFEAATAKLKKAYEAMEKTGSEPDMFAAEKLRLLNLRLKLRVLTRDPYVLPDYRLAAIQDEMIGLEKEIATAESKRQQKRAAQLKQESESIRDNFVGETNAKDEKAGEEARASLAAAEKQLADIVSTNRASLKKKLDEGRRDRQAAADGFKAASAGMQRPVSINPINAIRESMKIEYDRRLRRKAPAVAERNNVMLIIDTSYSPGRKAVDLTNEF